MRPSSVPRGLVAFHDVSQSTSRPTQRIARFWPEFREQHTTEERVVGGYAGFGIGLYRIQG
jgi:hypothetical protein